LLSSVFYWALSKDFVKCQTDTRHGKVALTALRTVMAALRSAIAEALGKAYNLLSVGTRQTCVNKRYHDKLCETF